MKPKTTTKDGAGNGPTEVDQAATATRCGTPMGVAELLGAGRLLAGPQHLDGYKPYVIVEGKDGQVPSFLPFAEVAPLPPFTQQRVTLNDADSFAAYVKRYKQTHTQIFATLPPAGEVLGSGARFTAVFDYHAGGIGVDPKPDRCAHVAVYPCPLSLPWKVWCGQNGKALSQAEFVKFVDNNMREIVSPDGATLLEIATNFEAHSEAEFRTQIDRKTGAVKLTFNETIEQRTTSGQMTLPDALGLSLPVFDGGASYPVQARLEFNPRGGKLLITFHLQRPYDVLRAALADLRGEIAAATDIQPLTGEAAGI